MTPPCAPRTFHSSKAEQRARPASHKGWALGPSLRYRRTKSWAGMCTTQVGAEAPECPPEPPCALVPWGTVLVLAVTTPSARVTDRLHVGGALRTSWMSNRT
jgi:hypothetical protein